MEKSLNFEKRDCNVWGNAIVGSANRERHVRLRSVQSCLLRERTTALIPPNQSSRYIAIWMGDVRGGGGAMQVTEERGSVTEGKAGDKRVGDIPFASKLNTFFILDHRRFGRAQVRLMWVFH